MATEEATFKTRDGTDLYTKTWKPSNPSSLHLIFIHGFSDHINAYYNLFPTLSSSPYNITVHGFDQRGWGRSVPADSKSSRGLTGDTTLVLTDIHDFILHVSKSLTSTPSPSPSISTSKLFLMGHSMGGAETLYYTLSTTPFTPPLPIPLTGILLESPHIAFPPAAQPSPLLVISGRLAAKVLPNKQMVQKLDSSAMSRNPQVCKDWEDDPLCHDTGTLRGLAGLLDRAGHLDSLGQGKNVHGLKGRLEVPAFWGHGDQDKVVDYAASRRLFKKVAGGNEGSVFRTYVGGYHKIHAEPEGMGEDFVRDAGSWICKVGGVGETEVEGQDQDQDQIQGSESAIGQQPVSETTIPDTSATTSEGAIQNMENGMSRSRL